MSSPIPSGAIAHRCWLRARVQRLLVIALCCAGFLLAVPTLLVDYSNAVMQYPDGSSMTTRCPIQHIAVWKNLSAGLRGQAVQANHTVGTEEESKLLTAFPDLLVTRLYRILAGRSKAAAEILLLFYIGALGGTAYLLWDLTSQFESDGWRRLKQRLKENGGARSDRRICHSAWWRRRLKHQAREP